jgi:predicted DNA-binding transcriptional regulator AlpA
MPAPVIAEYAVGVDEGMKITGLSRPSFWRGVTVGPLPKPFYPTPKCPRWWPSELRAAMEKTRASPTEQKENRRQTRLARLANA